MYNSEHLHIVLDLNRDIFWNEAVWNFYVAWGYSFQEKYM